MSSRVFLDSATNKAETHTDAEINPYRNVQRYRPSRPSPTSFPLANSLRFQTHPSPPLSKFVLRFMRPRGQSRVLSATTPPHFLSRLLSRSPLVVSSSRTPPWVPRPTSLPRALVVFHGEKIRRGRTPWVWWVGYEQSTKSTKTLSPHVP